MVCARKTHPSHLWRSMEARKPPEKGWSYRLEEWHYVWQQCLGCPPGLGLIYWWMISLKRLWGWDILIFIRGSSDVLFSTSKTLPMRSCLLWKITSEWQDRHLTLGTKTWIYPSLMWLVSSNDACRVVLSQKTPRGRIKTREIMKYHTRRSKLWASMLPSQ